MSEFDDSFFEEFLNEPAPNDVLASFLFEQFQEASLLRTRDLGRTTAHRGSPLRRIPMHDPASVVAGTEHIVMKPPHPDDSRGELADVYAYVSTRPTERTIEYGDRVLYLTGTYRVRITDPGSEAEEWVVDDDGAYGADLDPRNLEQADDPMILQMRAVDNARLLYEDRMSRYAIVFTQDPPEAA